MKYKINKIEVRHINRIKYILYNTELEQDIQVEYGKMRFYANKLENCREEEYCRFLKNDSSYNVIFRKDIPKDLRYSTDKKGTRKSENSLLTIFTEYDYNNIMFETNVFLQDNDSIYIGKRFNPKDMKKYFGHFTYHNKDPKETLLKVLHNATVINGGKFLCLAEISIQDLYDEKKKNSVHHIILFAMIDYLIKQEGILIDN